MRDYLKREERICLWMMKMPLILPLVYLLAPPPAVSSMLNSATAETGALQNGHTNGSDYVFDKSSGYYYISNLGYYYDPNTGLYRSATTGKWYKYDDETKEYEEVVSEVAIGEV